MPNVHSCACRCTTIAWIALGALLVLLVPFSVAHAQVQVDASVTPLGGSFRYDITVHNAGPDDVVLVSLLNGPLTDPLISPSLIAPAGFLANYDGGLGIIDLLEDSTSFGAGTSVTGFRFESLTLPGASFSTFEALSSTAAIQQGNVNFVLVPEASVAWPVLVVAGLAILQFLRGRSTRP